MKMGLMKRPDAPLPAERREYGPTQGPANERQPVHQDVVRYRWPTITETLEALTAFMLKKPTGFPVVMLPLLIVAIKVALRFWGGAQAVELAQSELWIIWAWCVLRTFV